MRLHIAATIALVAAAPAAAEVRSAGPHGFEVASGVDLPVPVKKAYAAFAQLGAWWSDDHTYSGKAANMALHLQPGGCLCEILPGGGGVEHLRVAVVQPNQRIVLTGSLGPVLYAAASGVMDVRFEPAGTGAKVTMSYRAAGFAKGDGDKLAPAVDKVLAAQMERFSAFASK